MRNVSLKCATPAVPRFSHPVAPSFLLPLSAIASVLFCLPLLPPLTARCVLFLVLPYSGRQRGGSPAGAAGGAGKRRGLRGGVLVKLQPPRVPEARGQRSAQGHVH